MTLKEYIDFWKLSWGYMRGSRLEFWMGLPRATWGYRKLIIEDRKRGFKNDT